MERGTKDEERRSMDAHSGHTRTRSFARPVQESGSAEHLRKLEALFSGNGAVHTPVTVSMGRAVVSEPKTFANPRRSHGKVPSEYRLKLERIRIARSPEEIQEAADTFLAHHQLPDDLDILLKVLQHPSEKVLREAMGQISALLIQGRVASTMLLLDRLNDVDARITEASTRSYVEGLRLQIQKMATR